MDAVAYTAWRGPWLGQDPIVNLLQGMGAVVLVAFLFSVSLEAPTRARQALAAVLALLHAAFVYRYAAVYDLSVRLLPFLDILVDPRGRASAVLDFTQLMLLYLVSAQLATRRREKQITPSAGASPDLTEPRPGPG